MKPKLLVSRCLLGHRVRYDGGASGPYDQLAQWQDEGRVVALCPEVAGGLPTPRAAAEIPGGQGIEVLSGRAPVITTDGEDVTQAFGPRGYPRRPYSMAGAGRGSSLRQLFRVNGKPANRYESQAFFGSGGL